MDRHQVYEDSTLTDAEIEAAKKFLREKPSTSYVQRKMLIGYNHAARIVSYLEALQWISEPDRTGVRRVLRD